MQFLFFDNIVIYNIYLIYHVFTLIHSKYFLISFVIFSFIHELFKNMHLISKYLGTLQIFLLLTFIWTTCSQKIYLVWFQSIYWDLFSAHGLPCDLMQLFIWIDLLPSFSICLFCVIGYMTFFLATFKISFDFKPLDYDMNGCGFCGYSTESLLSFLDVLSLRLFIKNFGFF